MTPVMRWPSSVAVTGPRHDLGYPHAQWRLVRDAPVSHCCRAFAHLRADEDIESRAWLVLSSWRLYRIDRNAVDRELPARPFYCRDRHRTRWRYDGAILPTTLPTRRVAANTYHLRVLVHVR